MRKVPLGIVIPANSTSLSGSINISGATDFKRMSHEPTASYKSIARWCLCPSAEYRRQARRLLPAAFSAVPPGVLLANITARLVYVPWYLHPPAEWWWYCLESPNRIKGRRHHHELIATLPGNWPVPGNFRLLLKPLPCLLDKRIYHCLYYCNDFSMARSLGNLKSANRGTVHLLGDWNRKELLQMTLEIIGLVFQQVNIIAKGKVVVMSTVNRTQSFCTSMDCPESAILLQRVLSVQ